MARCFSCFIFVIFALFSTLSLAAQEKGWVLESAGIKIAVSGESGLITGIKGTGPDDKELLAAPMEIYLLKKSEGKERFFSRLIESRLTEISGSGQNGKKLDCVIGMEDAGKEEIARASVTYLLSADSLKIKTAVEYSISNQARYEMGICLPVKRDQWDRHFYPRLPHYILSAGDASVARIPYGVSAQDATTPLYPKQPGMNTLLYPYGILENKDSYLFWGCTDIGRFVVLSPNNRGNLISLLVTPRSIEKGQNYTFDFTLKMFPKTQYRYRDILRWYVLNITSTDPLTKDLFPVNQIKIKTIPHGGNIAIHDLRTTRLDENKRGLDEDMEKMFLKLNLNNLWFGTWHKWNGSYPVEGNWYSFPGQPITAEGLKQEIQRLKEKGFKPFMYFDQFVAKEGTSESAPPYPGWLGRKKDGNLTIYDKYELGKGGTGRGSDWFTPEVAKRLGTETITFCYADFGNDEFRKWFVDSAKAVIEYYDPAGIAWDFGAGLIGDEINYSDANPDTNISNGYLRMQYEVYTWLKDKHPDKFIATNGPLGSLSQLYSDILLVENPQIFSDIDYEAARALGSVLMSMTYHSHSEAGAGYNQSGWTRLVMRNISHGIHYGTGHWILLGKDGEYINKWKTMLEFSARAASIPLIFESDAIETSPLSERITGSIWADDKVLMLALYNDADSDTIVSVKIDKKIVQRYGYKGAKIFDITPIDSAGIAGQKRKLSLEEQDNNIVLNNLDIKTKHLILVESER